jgi:predicted XRE-type DNA-binding protein
MSTLHESVANRAATHPAVQPNDRRVHSAAHVDLLRELRRSQNLTQVDVADILDVSQERVSAFERGGVGRAQIDTLRRYIEALGGRLHVEIELGGKRTQIS